MDRVFFYLEEDDKMPFLLDGDDDGAQYDPSKQRLFWELTDTKHVMGPLEEIEFAFGEVGKDES